MTGLHVPSGVSTPPPAPRPVSTAAPASPSRALQLGNVVLTQAAWFAAVLGAAHGRPDLGTLPALVVVAWHLTVARRPAAEAMLVALVALLGLVAETAVLSLGHVRFTSGAWSPVLPPYWLVALWAVFATSLNVTLRWLRGRAPLAAVLGAVAGPLAFSSGVRLGAAQFVDPVAAIVTLVVEWALMMPLLVAIARRLDGIGPVPDPAASTPSSDMTRPRP